MAGTRSPYDVYEDNRGSERSRSNENNPDREILKYAEKRKREIFGDPGEAPRPIDDDQTVRPNLNDSRARQVQANTQLGAMATGSAPRSSAAQFQYDADAYTNQLLYGQQAAGNMQNAMLAAKAGPPVQTQRAGSALASGSGELQRGFGGASREALTGATATRAQEQEKYMDMYLQGVQDLRGSDIDVYRAIANARKQQNALDAELARSTASRDQGMLGKYGKLAADLYFGTLGK